MLVINRKDLSIPTYENLNSFSKDRLLKDYDYRRYIIDSNSPDGYKTCCLSPNWSKEIIINHIFNFLKEVEQA